MVYLLPIALTYGFKTINHLHGRGSEFEVWSFPREMIVGITGEPFALTRSKPFFLRIILITIYLSTIGTPNLMHHNSGTYARKTQQLWLRKLKHQVPDDCLVLPCVLATVTLRILHVKIRPREGPAGAINMKTEDSQSTHHPVCCTTISLLQKKSSASSTKRETKNERRSTTLSLALLRCTHGSLRECVIRACRHPASACIQPMDVTSASPALLYSHRPGHRNQGERTRRGHTRPRMVFLQAH